jgi:pheophorbide a oxygenase
MPTASDTSVRAFRSWFKTEGQGQPKWAVGISDSSSSSAELTREALLERYHSHTKNCKSCREALADVQKASTDSKSTTV